MCFLRFQRLFSKLLIGRHHSKNVKWNCDSNKTLFFFSESMFTSVFTQSANETDLMAQPDPDLDPVANVNTS